MKTETFLNWHTTCSCADLMSSAISAAERQVRSKRLLHLHERVVVRDQEAIEELAETLLRLIYRRLNRTYRHAERDLLHDAAVDAIVDYLRHPIRFDSNRGASLEHYLYLTACSNAVDNIRSDASRRARENRYSESCESHGVLPEPEGGVSTGYEERLAKLLESAVSATEVAALSKWLDGERRTEPIAAALNLTSLSLADQRKEVKRFKDRMIKRFGRLRLHRRNS